MNRGISQLLIILVPRFLYVIFGSASDDCMYKLSQRTSQGLLGNVTAAKVNGSTCNILITQKLRANDTLKYLCNKCSRARVVLVEEEATPNIAYIIIRAFIKHLSVLCEQVTADCLTSLPVINASIHRKVSKRQLVSAIYPGTNYCGVANRSTSYADVGEDPADVCCREHDSCTIWLYAKETKFGSTNNNSYVVQSHCHCDKRFYWCLQKIRKIYREGTKALSIFSWFWDTLTLDCLQFIHSRVCTRTETECTGGLFNTCQEVCIQYQARYHAVRHTIRNGEIVPWEDN